MAGKRKRRRGVGGVLDRLILPFAPGWAERRARARLAYEWREFGRSMLSTYGGAAKTRSTADWPTKTTSADSAIIPDSKYLVARARSASRDFPLGRSGVDAFKRHVVGTGITCRSIARQPRTGREQTRFNEAADALWEEWSTDADLVDVERRKTLLGFQRLGIKELVEVGEAFIVPSVVEREEQVGLVLQALEPEQLDTSKIRGESGNEVRGGVEINAYGAAVAYWFYTTSHPADSYGALVASTRIPAGRVLHLMDPDRVRQTRGVTRLAAILKTLFHSSMYKDFELLAKRMEACFGLGVTSDAPGLDGFPGGTTPPAGETAGDSRGTDEVRFEPGMVFRAGPGEELQFFNPQRPGTQYGPYVDGLAAEIAAGMGLDFATIMRDFSRGSFSSQRQGLLEIWAETDPLQSLMIDLWLRRIRNDWLTLAVTQRLLDAPGFFEDPAWRRAYLAASWRGPAKRWIDPAKQAAAAKISLALRLATLRDIINEAGGDWRDIMRQGQVEEAFAKELGIDLVRNTGGTSPVEPRPGRKPPEDDGDDLARGGGNGDGLRRRVTADRR